jgi:hypothetical protein
MHGIEIEENAEILGEEAQQVPDMRKAARFHEEIRDMQDMLQADVPSGPASRRNKIKLVEVKNVFN